MKRTINTILALFAVAFTIPSCQKQAASNETQEASNGTLVTFHISEAPATKVAFGDKASDSKYPVSWVDGDKVGVSLNYATPVEGSIDENKDVTVTLTDDESTDGYKYAAFYPYSAFLSESEDATNSRLTLTIPTEQTSTASSPDASAILLGAYATSDEFSTDVDLKFKHLASYMHIKLENIPEGETLSSVVLTSTKYISNTWFYYPEQMKINQRNAKYAITVKTTDAEFWAVVGRQDFSNTDLTLLATTDKGTYEKTITFGDGCSLSTAGSVAYFTVDMGSGTTVFKEGKYTADLENDWTAATTGATYSFSDGYASIVTTASGTKYRGDVKYAGSEGIVFHAGNYPYIAVRMTLEGDSRNITIDGKSSDGSTYKGALGNGANKKQYAETLSDGSTVWVYNLSSQKWGTTNVLPTDEAVTFTTFQIKYADIVADSAPTWTLYDVQTFASLDEVNSTYGTSFSE